MTASAEQIIKLELAIEKTRQAVESWQEAGLPKHTIVILLAHSTKLPQKTIKTILNSIDTLMDDYFLKELDGK